MVKLIAFLKRRRGVGREEFARRWVESHAKMAVQLPGLRGYRINIATDLGQRAGADADEFTALRFHLYTIEHVIVPGP